MSDARPIDTARQSNEDVARDLRKHMEEQIGTGWTIQDAEVLESLLAHFLHVAQAERVVRDVVAKLREAPLNQEPQAMADCLELAFVPYLPWPLPEGEKG